MNAPVLHKKNEVQILGDFCTFRSQFPEKRTAGDFYRNHLKLCLGKILETLKSMAEFPLIHRQ